MGYLDRLSAEMNMHSYTAEEVKKIRAQLGLSQREAAKLAGRSWRCWQSWELGTRSADPAVISKLAAKVGNGLTNNNELRLCASCVRVILDFNDGQ